MDINVTVCCSWNYMDLNATGCCSYNCTDTYVNLGCCSINVVLNVTVC